LELAAGGGILQRKITNQIFTNYNAVEECRSNTMQSGQFPLLKFKRKMSFELYKTWCVKTV